MLHINERVVVNDEFHREATGIVKSYSRGGLFFCHYDYLISFDTFALPCAWIHERYITSLEEDEEIGYYPASVKW